MIITTGVVTDHEPDIRLDRWFASISRAWVDGAVVLALFDPNAYKPDIVQAVKRATGRLMPLAYILMRRRV